MPTHTKKIAILTAFADWSPAYSLTHVVADQCVMFLRRGYDTGLFVLPVLADQNIELPMRQRIRTQALSNGHDLALRLIELSCEYDLIITHDMLWLDSLQNYSTAFRAMNGGMSCPAAHWIHSIPCGPPQGWRKLPDGRHWIVYPNAADAAKAAMAFRCNVGRVLSVPHIVDVRTMFGFLPDTLAIVDAAPGLMTAEITQVYPAAADRLKDKGLADLVRNFGAIKRYGASVCLVLADSWSGRRPREAMGYYRKIAEQEGLSDHEFVVLSSRCPDVFGNGASRRVISELAMLGNIFIYPTRGEAFGLVAPEAVLSGGAIPFFADDMAGWCAHGMGISPLRSVRPPQHVGNKADFRAAAAEYIVETVRGSEASTAKSAVRRTLNLDSVYRDHYVPALQAMGIDAWPS